MLTHDQTRYIFETKTLSVTDKAVKVDDIVETVNHFRCIDLVIEGAHTKPAEVAEAIKALLKEYNSKSTITFDDILDFHVRFESIHPVQDCNGRVGRLIMFKECLKHNIVPFIITEELKMYYLAICFGSLNSIVRIIRIMYSKLDFARICLKEIRIHNKGSHPTVSQAACSTTHCYTS